MSGHFGAGSYVLMRGAPRIGDRGLTVAFRFAAANPATGAPQGVVAHAHDAAGWWIGLTGDGRAMIGVGTRSGPVSVAVGGSVVAGEWVSVVARVPGAPGERLEIEARRPGAEPRSAGAVIGSALVPAPGSVVWGARALRDAVVPEHAFRGSIADVVMIADSTATGDLSAHPALLGSWMGEVEIDASRFGSDSPIDL